MLELGIGIQGAKPIVSGNGIADPLGTVRAISNLIEAGHQIGLEFHQFTDFAELAKARQQVRQSNVSPMFDVEADRRIGDHAFWMNAVNDKGEVVALQAFRLDEAEPSLADWALGWMMGLYARRRELIVPRQPAPPEHSRTSLIKGQIAYHGEFWVEKHCKGCFNIFPRLGLLLALIKWQPEAIWALTGQSMATRGHMIRAGYGHIEQSFLTWEWEPQGAEPNEWIAIAERRHLEFSVSQMTATKA